MLKSFKQVLYESSLSRIYAQAKDHESGTISAFRYARGCGEGETYSKKENLDRNAVLKAKLLKLGYGVTRIKGTYIENYGTKDAVEVSEESFFVFDKNDKGTLKNDLVKLGKEFEQDSVTFSKPTGEYYLIGTNKCPNSYPGHGKEIKLGKPIFGKDGEFHSKINGRPFVFESIDGRIDELKNYSISEIRSITELANL